MTLPKKLTDQLNKRKQNNSIRSLKTTNGLVDFSSNDYLGLSRNETLKAKVERQSKNLNLGSTGSRLLSGNSAIAEETEAFLTEQFSAESCLILNSGYLANLAVISSIPQKGDTIIYDELVHASIKDGMRLSLANKKSFKHNDLADLKKRLDLAEGDRYVVIESAYSMDGDFAPLKDVIDICEKHKARLILDEAHTTGLYGRKGGGLSEELKLEDKIFCRVFTFGKAIGCHGAAIAGSKDLITYLINFARPFIYTTALPDHSYISIKEGFNHILKSNEPRVQLFNNVEFYNDLFEEKLNTKFSRVSNDHPIQTILISGNNNVKNAAATLQKSGFDVRPILSPTVKEGQERLRICLHSFNTEDEIYNLVATLANL
ncbi:aminotransferase class I/II-fold pyridoxal phosphate-dependent enzyme [Fulvivirga lutea]|uniref:Pyridoxal phosphate-dependent aminotransferase family protein n=1 Tax=Fulvivirga lutea TaxID=2810512 RepID=A0A974WF33_9BACT|nr:pyridoxal phosphate-dependent aminotransferase family protein [Fulvivirga lutea]QSE97273.1 pyridoxal phosphate-dependent aminotransferase family protein [Fulvivirga lutea]